MKHGSYTQEPQSFIKSASSSSFLHFTDVFFVLTSLDQRITGKKIHKSKHEFLMNYLFMIISFNAFTFVPRIYFDSFT